MGYFVGTRRQGVHVGIGSMGLCGGSFGIMGIGEIQRVMDVSTWTVVSKRASRVQYFISTRPQTPRAMFGASGGGFRVRASVGGSGSTFGVRIRQLTLSAASVGRTSLWSACRLFLARITLPPFGIPTACRLTALIRLRPSSSPLCPQDVASCFHHLLHKIACF